MYACETFSQGLQDKTYCWEAAPLSPILLSVETLTVCGNALRTGSVLQELNLLV